nr:hypothetical protein CFP56_43573 [Quercus suber]
MRFWKEMDDTDIDLALKWHSIVGKNRELHGFEKRLATTDKEKTLADKKEIKAMKKEKEQESQNNYDLGFRDAKSSFDNVIREAQATSFLDGWVSSLNIPNIPLDSSHKVLENVSLPEDIFPKKKAPKG